MSLLYGILMHGVPLTSISGFFKKRCTTTTVSDRMRVLLDLLVKEIPESRRAQFACALCYLTRFTPFGDDMQKLDGNNTYFDYDVGSVTGTVDAANCMHDLTCGPDMLKHVKPLLDADILERLYVPLWHEIAAGICLQLLRWAKQDG